MISDCNAINATICTTGLLTLANRIKIIQEFVLYDRGIIELNEL